MCFETPLLKNQKTEQLLHIKELFLPFEMLDNFRNPAPYPNAIAPDCFRKIEEQLHSLLFLLH